MNDIPQTADNYDSALFRKHSQKFLLEQDLEPYYDKQVAWSLDGNRIVASADSFEQLFEELEKVGIPINCVVSDYIPSPHIGNI